MKSVVLASTCTRMRALEAKMRYPFCLQVTAPSEEHLLPSFKVSLERNAHKFDAVKVLCKTASLSTLRALHKATNGLANLRLSFLDDDGYTDIGGDDLMSHVLSDIYKHLSELNDANGSKMEKLLQELGDAVRNDENIAIRALRNDRNIAINALEAKIFRVGYDCDWCKEWDAVWAWGVSDYIYTGAESQLEISFHFWTEKAKTRLFLEVNRCSDRELLDRCAGCMYDDGQSSLLSTALKLYRDVKKWENHSWEPADGSDDEEHDDEEHDEDDVEDAAEE